MDLSSPVDTAHQAVWDAARLVTGMDKPGADADATRVEFALIVAHLAGPGVEAMRLLTWLAEQPLTDEQRLSMVELWQPQLAWVAGAEQAAVVALVGLSPDQSDVAAVKADEFVSVELAAALSCSRRQAQHRIDYARLLHEQFSATGAMLRSGELDPYRAWLIVDTLATVSPQIAAGLEAQLLPGAAGRSTAWLRRQLRDGCRKADPDWTLRRFAAARRTRRVEFHTDGDDGLVGLYAALPPVEALAMQRHLELAAEVRSADPDDARCKDERMADALMACVLGSAPGDPTTPMAPQVVAQVLVSLPTLLGLREDCAELRGYGPVPAGLVRALAADAEWQRWVYEPVDGHLLDLGNHHYRCTGGLDRYVRARDRVDRWVAGTLPAEDCDLDHTEPFLHENGPTCHPPDRGDCPHSGGGTASRNLAALSRSPHRAKTHGGYHTRQDPDATLHISTPLGRVYTTRPWDYRPDSER